MLRVVQVVVREHLGGGGGGDGAVEPAGEGAEVLAGGDALAVGVGQGDGAALQEAEDAGGAGLDRKS
ncbi:MAG: hypothetical protein LBV60_01920, partial [Streptomyces sp.]|nr:hypothetical protein [Streptomyces sp.]